MESVGYPIDTGYESKEILKLILNNGRPIIESDSDTVDSDSIVLTFCKKDFSC